MNVADNNERNHREASAESADEKNSSQIQRSPKPKRFEFNQLGNAQRLICYYGREVRYCAEWKSWLVWNRRRWCVDKTGAIHRKAHDTIREIRHEARAVRDEDLKSKLKSHAHHCSSKTEIEAMIDIARTLEGVSVTTDQLDKDPLLLNCRNGVVNLRDGSLTRHERSQQFLITKMAPVNYHPDASCPTWLRFLSQIFGGDSAVIGYVQKIIGYSLTGAVTEKAMFMFHGDGDNGKTTLLKTIRQMLGDYAGIADIDALMQGSQDSARERTIADLHGKRFITTSETEYKQKFRESMIKRLTGMDRLKGRYLYSNAFEFEPTHKLFMDVNHKPDIRGTDEAIWTRMQVVPFGVTIPAKDKDKDLLRKLCGELPGIFAWAVRGCLMWRKEGLTIPRAIRTASEGYRQEMDLVSMFIADACVKEPDAFERTSKLYATFTAWCRDNGEDDMGQNAFSRRLAKLGYKPTHTRDGNGWKGLCLRTDNPTEAPALLIRSFRNVNLNDIEAGDLTM